MFLRNGKVAKLLINLSRHTHIKRLAFAFNLCTEEYKEMRRKSEVFYNKIVCKNVSNITNVKD